MEELDICSICFDNIKNEAILADCGKCKLLYHNACYNEFKNKLKFNCPICRKEKHIMINNEREIFETVFSKFQPIINFFTNYIDRYTFILFNKCPNIFIFGLIIMLSFVFVFLILCPITITTIIIVYIIKLYNYIRINILELSLYFIFVAILDSIMTNIFINYFTNIDYIFCLGINFFVILQIFGDRLVIIVPIIANKLSRMDIGSILVSNELSNIR